MGITEKNGIALQRRYYQIYVVLMYIMTKKWLYNISITVLKDHF